MSEENIEIARRSAMTWHAGDFEAFWTFHHPEVEWELTLSSRLSKTRRARGGAGEGFRRRRSRTSGSR